MDRLTRDFPTTPHAADALFWLARCDDLQSHPVALDQTETERALQRYAQFLEQYPEHERAAEARERTGLLRDRLAEKRYRSGRLYMRLKQYRAAEIYFGTVVLTYPESRWARGAALLLADAQAEQGRTAEAVETLRRLLSADPDAELRGRAERRLRELETPGAPP